MIIALVSLIVLIILILCVPLELAFHTNIDGMPRFNMKLVWLFGVVRHESRPRKKKPIEHKTEAAHWINQAEITFDVLRIRGFLKQFVNLIRRIVGRTKIRELAVNLKLALDNPADTGLLFAVLGPLNVLISYFSPYQIRIEPSFAGDAILQGYIHGAMKLWPIQLALPIIAFAFSSPALRAARKLVAYKWKRKESSSVALSPSPV